FYFAACKKNNDAPTISTSIDSLNFINAYSIPFNIYLNGTRLNGNSNLTAGGSSGYYTVPSGIQTYQVKKVFDPSTSIVQTLFSYSPNLTPHHYYSLFVSGATDSSAFVIQDNLPLGDTTSGKCQVRFVNASPDAGSLDFSIGGVKYSNQPFKAGSDFGHVDTAALSPIILFKAGTTDTLISGHYPLLQGYIYTFYAKGSLTGTGNSALGIGVTVNAQ
ncbi:MAG: DUF4397 domain-containing protein, partial [Bacteroidetes bacterium]|nr:DUF4397 domain-containing protein [Bacteroidota bacterium]